MKEAKTNLKTNSNSIINSTKNSNVPPKTKVSLTTTDIKASYVPGTDASQIKFKEELEVNTKKALTKDESGSKQFLASSSIHNDSLVSKVGDDYYYNPLSKSIRISNNGTFLFLNCNNKSFCYSE